MQLLERGMRRHMTPKRSSRGGLFLFILQQSEQAFLWFVYLVGVFFHQFPDTSVDGLGMKRRVLLLNHCVEF